MTYLIRKFLMRFSKVVLACLTGAILFLATTARAQDTTPVDCVVAAYYPPFMVADTVDGAGMSIEIMREAAKRAGRSIEIQFMPFPRTLMALQSDNTCIMPAMFRNETREGKYTWIATYDAARLRFLTMGDTVNNLEAGRDLRSIGVETGASADQFLSNIGFENLVRLSGPSSSARMLHAGRIDAWAQTGSVASGMWQQLDLAPPVQIGPPIYSVPVYITAGLGIAEQTASAYRAAIDSMLADGTVVRILAAYK
ncbi:MAG: transporter substrate-binding domain-containing protein [Pseudomonadota bacterium]